MIRILTERIKVNSAENCGITNITGLVSDKISKLGFISGNVTIFMGGSTGGVTTIEYEPGLLQDLPELLERLIPSDIAYQHDKTWGDGNGFSHLRSALIGPSLTVPFDERKLLLGTWQQIIAVNFDNRPRTREIILQIIGEDNG